MSRARRYFVSIAAFLALFQDAFARSLDRIEQVRAEESVVAWFYRTLRNTVVDHHRKLGSSGRTLERLATELAETEAPAPELHQTVCRCVARLADGRANRSALPGTLSCHGGNGDGPDEARRHSQHGTHRACTA